VKVQSRMMFAPNTLAFTPDARLLIVAPVFHTAGWSWTLYGLAGGMTQIQLSQARPATMFDAMEQLGVTHAQWVPAILSDLLKENEARQIPKGQLKMVGYGASPIAPSLLQACLDTFGCKFTQVYGMTESIGPITHLPPSAHRNPDPRVNQAKAQPGRAWKFVLPTPTGWMWHPVRRAKFSSACPTRQPYIGHPMERPPRSRTQTDG
jgi:acyl-CoA synthetase (AMP-forming)/AMP-acid ligase II